MSGNPRLDTGTSVGGGSGAGRSRTGASTTATATPAVDTTADVAAGAIPTADGAPTTEAVCAAVPVDAACAPVDAACAPDDAACAKAPADAVADAASSRRAQGDGAATSVRIVVPHYDAPDALGRLLTALDAQTTQAFEVVVADDGSRRAPSPGAHPYPVHVVRQPDLGFRAAAARNLGASPEVGVFAFPAAFPGAVASEPPASTPAPALVLFLDADMVPTPTYVAAMVAALQRADVVVGRRRHADLSGLSPERVRAWLTTPGPDGAAPGEAPPPGVADLGEPAWLADGYAATGGLARMDDDGFRYVISAVLGVRRETFEAVGGFEESFRAYGGEDWEFGHRAWLAGATFAHDPAAVAWHDGPDWAGRATDPAAARAQKNREALAVADLVPSPRLRDPHRVWRVPRIVVEFDERPPRRQALALVGDTPSDPGDLSDPGLAFAVAADLLRGSDARMVTTPDSPLAQVWPDADPGVVTSPLPPSVLARVPYRVRVHAPVRLDEPGALTRLVEAGDAAYVAGGRPVLTVRHARSIALGVPPPQHPLPESVRTLPPGPPDLEARWGGWG